MTRYHPQPITIPNITKLSTLILYALILTTSQALTLNKAETILFQSRLDAIQTAVQTDFRSNYLPRQNQNQKQKQQQQNDIDLVLIFPGAGGPDAFTRELEETIRQTDADTLQTARFVETYDWMAHRGSVVTAAFDAEAVGDAVANTLWEVFGEKNQLRSVHCIGISVGAFAGNACATQISEFAKLDGDALLLMPPPHVRLTLLDPFCSRGLWGSNYGAKHFGRVVDYAEQYLNTDDPVPTTNDPLPLCACFDVTGSAEREAFVLPEGETMHCWPLVYFARFGYGGGAFVTTVEGEGVGGEGRIGLLYHGRDGYPERGTVLSIP